MASSKIITKEESSILIAAIRDLVALEACKQFLAKHDRHAPGNRFVVWAKLFQFGSLQTEGMPDRLDRAAAAIDEAAAAFSDFPQVSVIFAIIEAGKRNQVVTSQTVVRGRALRISEAAYKKSLFPDALRPQAKLFRSVAKIYRSRKLELTAAEDDVRRIPILLFCARNDLQKPNFKRAVRMCQLANLAKASDKTLRRLWKRLLGGELPETVAFLRDEIATW